jgi:hypothetical protein
VPTNEQLAQVFVAHLADTTEPLFATARLLKWRQSQPGSELPPRKELMRVGYDAASAVAPTGPMPGIVMRRPATSLTETVSERQFQ